MDIFITGFLGGIISVIAVGVFVWSISKRKGSTPSALKRDIDRNNLDTRQGIDSLKGNNSESGKIIDEAGGVAAGGLSAIEDTDRTISEIIAAATGDGKEEPEG